LGNHSAITFYPAEFLVNAEMSSEAARQRHGIRSARLYGWAWEPDNLDEDGVDEVSEVVIETNTLPYPRYLDALMFSWLILNFHVDGWTQLLARFLRRRSGVSYRQFYESLQSWILAHPHSLLGQEYCRMRRSWEEYFATGRQGNYAYRFGEMQIQGYMQIHGTQYALRAQPHLAWADIGSFFREFDHGLNNPLAEDLLQFQDVYVTRFGRPFSFVHQAQNNLWEFLRGDEQLRSAAVTYELNVTEPYDRTDVDDFLNKTYFRRRAGFGKMLVTRRALASAARADVVPISIVSPIA
jgi:hypothetical protein